MAGNSNGKPQSSTSEVRFHEWSGRNGEGFKDVDISQVINKDSNNNLLGEGLLKKTALKYISETVNKLLEPYAEDIFLEYSLVASTLDPNSLDKLQCCSYIYSNEESFKNFINKNYTECINAVANEFGISIYQHPNFLFDIKEDVFTGLLVEQKAESQEGGAKVDSKPSSLFMLTKKEGLSTKIDTATVSDHPKPSLSPSIFHLERRYSDMIEGAKARQKNNTEPSLEKIHDELHARLHKELKNDSNTYYISFPIYGARSANQLPENKITPPNEATTPLQAIGACFIFFTSKKKSSNDDTELKKSISKVVSYVSNTIRFVSVTYLFNLGLQLQKKAKEEAEKSAKAAIMSRNMSHNLGSHIMSYLKYKLNDQKDSFYRGLGHFIDYLQERQDFIATVSTNYVPYYFTVNFKDFVYDVLNPDKRQERHPSLGKIDNILLDFIARSEGLGRSAAILQDKKLSEIVIKFDNFNGSLPVTDSDKEQESFAKLRKLNISLPGGIVGRQAIFSIIENTIRNAAKHGDWQSKNKLEFTIKIYDPITDLLPEDDKVEDGDKSLKEIYDSYYKDTQDMPDLYIVTVEDNTNFSKENLETISNGLQEGYVNEKGVMLESNKGLKEMRISAAWLRSIRDESKCYKIRHSIIDEKTNFKAPIIYARMCKGADNESHLQYLFCLLKPKRVALVYEDNKSLENKKMPCEWKIFTKTKFLKEQNKSYEFIICEDSLWNELRPQTSCRLFKKSCNDLVKDIFDKNEKHSEDRIKKCEIELNKELAKWNEGECINITDHKVSEKYGNENQSLPSNVRLSKEDVKPGSFHYKTHYGSESELKSFMSSDVANNIVFVEGITGHNSTDRLVRNEPIDEVWAYKHLHAMKQRIAIFDERLFARIYGLNENDFIHLATNDDDVAKLKTLLAGKLSKDDYILIEQITAAESLNLTLKDLNVVLFKDEAETKDHIALTYAQKGIFLFNIVKVIKDGKPHIVLLGPKLDVNGKVEFNSSSFKCKCAILGFFEFRDEIELSIESEIAARYKNFNFITIHQGLLDKMYDFWKIKKNDACSKNALTKRLFNLFKKENEDIVVSVDEKGNLQLYDESNGAFDDKNKRDFVPGAFIHSGRSKPGGDDMPQVLPFIQYAALEASVMDCKYSLVELLDNARYEQ